jgi:N-acyl homoserine lactone hydrolase
MGLTIYPVNTGYISIFKGFHATQGRGVDQHMDIPATAWYIDGASKKVLVDTGMCDTERANRWHHKGSRQTQPITEALAGIGLAPKEIDLVIFTHLHWDHCANLKAFVNAKLIVHKTELEFALDPLPPYYRSYESAALGLSPPFAGVEFEQVHGEKEILPGIAVFPTPGHSPGHQSVTVETSQGTYVIAGDAVFVYENLDGDPEHHLPYIPIGRFVNLFDMWHSIETIDQRADFVLPGHDVAVFKQAHYP